MRRTRNSKVGVLKTSLIFITALRAFALDPARPVTDYGMSSWGLVDGLPSASIRAVLQSRSGYLWLATDGGLVRFDGKTFTAFTRSNSVIPSNALTALHEDSSGVLWIGLHDGLCRMQANTFVCFGANSGLPPGEISSITSDGNGGVWLGIVGSGICRLRAGKFSRFTAAQGLVSDNVTSVLMAHDGSLWVSTYDAGVSVYRDQRAIGIAKPVLPSNLVWNMAEDRSGSIFVATFAGLCRFKNADDRQPDLFTRAQGLPETDVTNVFIEKSGSIWVATSDGGLSRLDGARFSTLTSRDGLADMSVLSLAEDQEGNLWAGTKSGLNRLRDQAFSMLRARSGLVEDAVRIVFEDQQHDLWVGTYNKGLQRVASHISSENKPGRVSVKGCSPLAAYPGKGESLWLGCAGGKIRRIEGNRTVADYPLGNSQRFVEVNALAGLGDHRLFAATFGLGLLEFVDGAWVPAATTLHLKNIVALLGGDDGLWVASLDRGLFHIKADGSIDDYKQQLGDDIPLRLNRDGAGAVWVTTTHGLALVEEGVLSLLRLQGTPLADGTLYNLIDDRIGFYWISSSRGVYRIRKEELKSLVVGKRKSLAPVLFSFAEGATNVNDVGFAQPTSWRTDDGRLWFTTSRGLLTIDPAHVAKNLLPPPVFVEGLLADSETVVPSKPGEDFQVPPNRHRLEIQFTALSLKVPENVRFVYRLDPFDAGWTDARQGRFAFYTDLPPGHYRFHAKACNNDGVWNEAGAEMAIHILPAYYQTQWFRLLCLAAALLAAWVFYRRHLSRIRREIALVQTTISREQQKSARERLSELTESNRVLRRSAGRLAQVAEPGHFLGVFLREAMDLTGATAGAVFRRVGQTEFAFESLIQDGVELQGAELDALPCAEEKRRASREDVNGFFARLASGEFLYWRINDEGKSDLPLALQYHREHGQSAFWELPFSVNDRVEGSIALAFRSEVVPTETTLQTLTALNSQLAIALELTRVSKENQKATLAMEKIKILAEERSRIAREIHDTLAQCFTGILMQLQAASEYFNVNGQVARACVQRAENMARSGLQQARASVIPLSTSESKVNLIDGIRSAVENALTDTGTGSEVTVTGETVPLDAIVSANVLRICQEALSNAQRYAGASHLSIALNFSPIEFSMTISDDGVGFDPGSVSGLGFGLSGMRTRAERIGGSLLIESATGEGTSIQLNVPLLQAEDTGS